MVHETPPAHATSVTRRGLLKTVGSAVSSAVLGTAACAPVVPPLPLVRTRLHRAPRVAADAGASLVPTSAPAFAPNALGYGGRVPGPVLEARTGGEVHVVLDNRLSEPTTLHSHGAVVAHEMDGHPIDAVPPGASRAYRYPVLQRAGLLWVHPHPHGRVAAQVYHGLAGCLVVRDEDEDQLGLPSGDRELFLALRDATFDAEGRLRYAGSVSRIIGSGFRGRTPVVNGTPHASCEVETALYRLRLLNASNARVFRLSLSSGAPLTIIGNDGGTLPAPVRVPSAVFGPAERLDVLLDLRTARPGDRVALRCEEEGWDLLVFEVARAVEDVTEVPTDLPAIPSLPDVRRVDRTFRFQGNHTINERFYQMGEVRARVPFGRTERWRFEGQLGGFHSVHVHGTQFQIVRREGQRSAVLPFERGWKDTVLLLSGEAVEVLVRFDRYRGLYLLHCHKLEHEDSGMMLDFLVE